MQTHTRPSSSSSLSEHGRGRVSKRRVFGWPIGPKDQGQLYAPSLDRIKLYARRGSDRTVVGNVTNLELLETTRGRSDAVAAGYGEQSVS
jgi:hypothetical protein